MTPAGSLSGGNQQKVIVAREFSRRSVCWWLLRPTPRPGCRFGEYIHGRILDKREEGCAVLLVSSELDEIMALSDALP